MATYKSMSSLKKAIRRKAQSAMGEISSKGQESARRNTESFYTGTPVVYERTGKLGDSPATNGVSGSGDCLSTEIYLNDDYSYDAGTWSAAQVMDAAENNNLVGTGGFWERTTQDIPEIINDAMLRAGFVKK